MKEKQIEIKNYVKKFEAYDGTLFDSADECKKYEGTAQAVIGARVQPMLISEKSVDEADIPFAGYGCDDTLLVYHIRNKEDLDNLNMMLQFYGFRRRIDLGLHTMDTFRDAYKYLYDGSGHYDPEHIKKMEDEHIGKKKCYKWESVPYDSKYIGETIVFDTYDYNNFYMGRTRKEIEEDFAEAMDNLFGAKENK